MQYEILRFVKIGPELKSSQILLQTITKCNNSFCEDNKYFGAFYQSTNSCFTQSIIFT